MSAELATAAMSTQKNKGHIIFIDNLDSFTYNLVDELAQMGFGLDVYRNTVSTDFIAARLAEQAAAGPVLLCLSPGPGHPRDAGNLIPIIQHANGVYPMLGICLGFQALIQQAGGVVDRCFETVHGKTSHINCNTHPIFAGLSNPLPVARYHSLMATEVPSEAQVIATVNNIPMAFYHANQRSIGFQFHPESIMTTDGVQLLQQSIEFLMQERANA